MKKFIYVTLFLAAAMLFLLPKHKGQAQVAGNSGTTIVYEEYSNCDPEKTQTCVPKARYEEYRRPTGEYVLTSEELAGNTGFKQVRISGKGKLILAHPEVGAYFSVQGKSWTPEEFAKRTPSPLTNCEQKDHAQTGTGSVFNYPVLVFNHEDKDSVKTSWVSTGLNCGLLKEVIQWKETKDSQAETSYKVAVSVTVGDQPDSVWNPPAGSKETSPIEVQHLAQVRKQIRMGKTPQAAEDLWSQMMKPQILQRIGQMQKIWETQHPSN